ncbi:nuclear transport factor 2 family protein [Flavobacterium hauense]
MDIHTFINDWIAAGNAFDVEQYLEFYWADAILDDPSVGRKFIGHEGIKDYFQDYFIGYNTQTRLVHLQIKDDIFVHLEVEFIGDFTEGSIGGMFDLTFKNNKIAFVKADLLH